MPKKLSDLSNLEIDKLFQIESYALESKDYDSKHFYTDGLTSADALYTDYQDLLQIHKLLIALGVKSFCDLGAGIGRAKLLFDYLKSPFQSYSIEFVKERHYEGLKSHKKLNLPFPEGFQNSNLLTCPPPQCDAYFIYLPVGEVLEKTLAALESIFLNKSCYIIAIESHGDLLNYLEDTHDHFKLIEKIPLKAKRHHEQMCLYQWSPKKEKIPFWSHWKEFKNRENFQILVEDDQGTWLADLKDSQFGIQRHTVETQFPPRIIPLSQVKGFVEIKGEGLKLIEKRRAAFKGPLGEMRKLFVLPSPQVEYSSGQKKELEVTWEMGEIHHVGS